MRGGLSVAGRAEIKNTGNRRGWGGGGRRDHSCYPDKQRARKNVEPRPRGRKGKKLGATKNDGGAGSWDAEPAKGGRSRNGFCLP